MTLHFVNLNIEMGGPLRTIYTNILFELSHIEANKWAHICVAIMTNEEINKDIVFYLILLVQYHATKSRNTHNLSVGMSIYLY